MKGGEKMWEKRKRVIALIALLALGIGSKTVQIKETEPKETQTPKV